MDDFQLQLKAAFLEEAAELLTSAEQSFLQLESSAHDPSIIENIFRLAHNLKGSARAVGFMEMGEFTHGLESLLLKIKNREMNLGPETIDLLLRCNDYLIHMVNVLKSGGEFEKNDALVEQIKAAMNQVQPEVPTYTLEELPPADAFNDEPSQVEAPPPSDDEGDRLIAAAFAQDAEADTSHEAAQIEAPHIEPAPEPIPAAPVAASVPPTPVRNIPEAPKADAKGAPVAQEESIRISLGRLETLVNNIGELVILQTVLTQQRHLIPSQFLQKTITQLSKITKDIQDISMGLRMVPLKQTFQKMQRIVRDTSKDLNKTIHLEMHGEETELDKTVVDRLGDPLVHMIRNAVDHGIETTEERQISGKNLTSNILLSASHRGGKIVIEVRDDGRGIDTERVRKKAIEKKIVRPDQKMSETEIINLLFHPGFSTKNEVTDISGRGVGLDVVKTSIEKVLQGEVNIDTELGVGTSFRITLPLTLAIIDGMVIRAGGERYIVPLTHVYESLKPKLRDIHKVTGIGDVLKLRNENIPIHRLSTLLSQKTTQASAASDDIAIVVRSGSLPFSIIVDEIIGRQQVVIKKLGDEIGTLKGISGGAILGDGGAALILDLNELVQRKTQAKPKSA